MNLFDLLTVKEKNELNDVLKNKKNSRLLLLFKNSHLIEKNKDELYKILFKKKRTKQNDYLLRNEIRLLKNEIKYFLACRHLTHINQESEHLLDSLYIKELFRRKPDKETIKEAESVIEKMIHRNDLQNYCEIMPLFIKQKIYLNNPDSLIKHNIALQLENLSKYCKKLMYLKIMETEYIKAYLHKITAHLNTSYKYSFPEELMKINLDATAEYYKTKALSLLVKDTERLKLLLRMKELLPEVNLPRYEIQKEKATLYTNIALEYSFNFNYLEAINYLNQSIALKKYLLDINYIFVLYNYISILIKAGKYNEALTTIELNYNFFKKDKSILFRLNILKVAALVYNKEYQSAKKEIPTELKQGSFDDYVYLRCLLAIIYFETSKTDLALREVKNIMQILRNNKHMEYHIEFCKNMQNIISLYYEWNMLSINKKINAVKKIKNKLDYKKYARKNILPMMWINNNIDRIFALKN